PDGVQGDGQAFLAAAQGFLGLLEFCDVARGGIHETARMRHRLPRQYMPRAVLVLIAVFKVKNLFTSGNLSLDFGESGSAIVGVYKVEKRSCEHFLHAPTQRLREGGIQPLEIAVRTGDAEHVQRECDEAVAVSVRLLTPLKIASFNACVDQWFF